MRIPPVSQCTTSTKSKLAQTVHQTNDEWCCSEFGTHGFSNDGKSLQWANGLASAPPGAPPAGGVMELNGDAALKALQTRCKGVKRDADKAINKCMLKSTKPAQIMATIKKLQAIIKAKQFGKLSAILR